MSKEKRGKPEESVFAGDGGSIPRSEINENDVLLGRGHVTNKNPGNIKFKKRVHAYKPRYLVSDNADKKFMAAKIVAEIRDADPPGRFLELEKENDTYKEVGDKRAREKTMSALRDGAPAVRKELVQMEQDSTPVDGSRKRGQCAVSGGVEKQPSKHLSVAKQCLRVVQRKIENESTSTGAADAKPKRVQVTWEQRYDELVEFKRIHGHTKVPQKYDPNPSFGRWVQKQRYEYLNRKVGKLNYLNNKRLKLLEDIGFVWNTHDDSWDFQFQQMLWYKERYGNCHISSSFRRNPVLGKWAAKQRYQYRDNKKKMLEGDADAAAYMASDRIKKLDDIGFCFALLERECETTYDIPSVPDDVEGYFQPEQNDQELDDSSRRLFQNARTLFATAEEVRKSSRSMPATADNSAPTWCGLSDLNNDALWNIIEFCQVGDDCNWKQKMSLVCTDWRRAVLSLDSCTIHDLSTADLLNVFSWLELSEVVNATQTCRKWDDLLSLALLRPELLPCVNDQQWAPLLEIAADVLENAKDVTKPLFSGCVPKYPGFLQCKECTRSIVHPPPKSDTRQKYRHVCCPRYDRGLSESFKIADFVSKSGNINNRERMFLFDDTIDELVSSSEIPETYKNGRYFKKDATSLERNIIDTLSDFFERLIIQGESFRKMCKDTYPILGRRQKVLLSLLVAFCVYVGPCKVGSSGSGQIENGCLVALPRMQSNGSSSYPNELFIRELPFAAMKFNNRRPARAGEGFLIAAGSLLGTVVNKQLEYGGKSFQDTSMIYFAGLRTNSLWEHCLNHSSFYHDFGRRLLPSNGEGSEEQSSSPEEQEQAGPALSNDEREALEQEIANERQSRVDLERRLAEALSNDEREALEQEIANERQSRVDLERRLAEALSSNEREALDQEIARERQSRVDLERRLAEALSNNGGREALEQEIARERQSRVDLEHRLEQAERRHEEEMRATAVEQQLRSEEQDLAMAELMCHVSTFQQRMMNNRGNTS